MILFGGEISISRQIVTEKQTLRLLLLWEAQVSLRGLFRGAVWTVCGGQVIFQAVYLPWDCELQREEVI